MWTALRANRLTLGVAATSISTAIGLIILQSESQVCMRQSPLDASKLLHDNDAYAHRQRLVIGAQQMQDLESTGLLVLDNVATSKEVQEARLDIDRLLEKKKTKKSFESNGLDDSDVRSDSVMWISESILHESLVNADYLSPSLKLLLRIVRSVPFELEQGGALGALGVPVLNQLACYDGGGSRYVAHRDNPNDDDDDKNSSSNWKFINHLRKVLLSQQTMNDRRYTIILYLNEPIWDDKADLNSDNKGGYLRCYLNTTGCDDIGCSGVAIDIEPRGGRLVIFDSKRVLHEVLPSPKRRLALTCWCGGQHTDKSNKATWLQLLSSPAEEFDYAKMRRGVYQLLFTK